VTLALRRGRSSSVAGSLHLARRRGAVVATIFGGKPVQTSARNMSQKYVVIEPKERGRDLYIFHY
jgi:hypothetical protein